MRVTAFAVRTGTAEPVPGSGFALKCRAVHAIKEEMSMKKNADAAATDAVKRPSGGGISRSMGARKKRGEGRKPSVADRSCAGSEPVSGRALVYDYIQKQMKEGALLPGSALDLKAISQKLGLSSTPLRDSLIRLEAEGYLTIHPRSKVVINTLELADFPFLYEIMGGLEYTVIAASMQAYTPDILAEMRRLNAAMKSAILTGEMTLYDNAHYAFHETFFNVSPNIFARRILTPIKNRLWDLPRKNFVREWYLAAIAEHALIVEAIEARSQQKLMHVLKELHWGFRYNEPHIRKVYNF